MRRKAEGEMNIQHMFALLFVDLRDPAEFMVPAGSLEELPAIVTDTRLAKLELQQCLSLRCAVCKQGGAVVVPFRLNRVFVFK